MPRDIGISLLFLKNCANAFFLIIDTIFSIVMLLFKTNSNGGTYGKKQGYYFIRVLF